MKKTELNITPDDATEIIKKASNTLETLNPEIDKKKTMQLKEIITTMEQTLLLYNRLLESEKTIKEYRTNLEKKEKDIIAKQNELAQKENTLNQWKKNLLDFQTQLNMSVDKTAFDMANSIVPKQIFFLPRNTKVIMNDIISLMEEIKPIINKNKEIIL